MKTKNKILILGGVLTAFIVLTAFNSLLGPKDFLILRTIEAHGSVGIPCAIIISKSDGTTENIELQRYSQNTERTIENMKKITSKIVEIQAMGYELENFSGGGGAPGTVYTYYFEKK